MSYILSQEYQDRLRREKNYREKRKKQRKFADASRKRNR